MLPADPQDILAIKLNLYRELLAAVSIHSPEIDIIRMVVEAIWEFFPGHRVSYSRIAPDGTMTVLCSRASPGLIPLDGLRTSLAEIPDFLGALRRGETVVVSDVRREPMFAPLLSTLLPMTGSVARFDCPGEVDEDGMGMLSLTSPTERNWESAEVDIVSEVADLVHLILRDARARIRIKNSEAIFRQFADHVESVFWMSDVGNHEIIYVSSAYERVWGRSRADLNKDPRAFIEAVLPEDRELLARFIDQHGRGPDEIVYRIRQPNGNVRWIRDRSYPVLNDRGEVYRVAGIAEDITDLREAQRRLEDSQAQVLSNAKFAALGEMASSIAHEINNPLAVIQGLASQIQEVQNRQPQPDAFMIDSLRSIEKMSKRIAAIVKGLRTFSRQTDWDPFAPADLASICQETLAICEPKLREKGIELSVERPDGELWVRCRSFEISQVLLNLLNNAMDALDRAQKKNIYLRVGQSEKTIFVSVEDDGPGVEESVREQIFRPFFTTKEVGRGTGLGLSISKNIMDAHGGNIYLDLAAGRTRFVVELPAEKI